MTKKNKAMLFFTVIVLFAFVLSFSFIVHASNHDCIGESCEVCAHIAAVSETLRNLFSAVFACALALALTCAGCKWIVCSVDAFSQSTPVVLKVKLLN